MRALGWRSSVSMVVCEKWRRNPIWGAGCPVEVDPSMLVHTRWET